MSDRMSIDPALLPHLNRQLGAISTRTHAAGATVRRLAAWAGGVSPALSAAAQELTLAHRALDDTTTHLDATRRDINRRAAQLDLEHGAGGGAALTAAKRGDLEPNAGDDPDWPQGLLDRFWYTLWDLKVHDDGTGTLDFGLGLLHAEMGETDSTEVQEGSSLDILSANATFGLLDPETRRSGWKGSAQAGSLKWVFGHNSPGIQSLEVNVARAQAEASVGEDGATFGFGASAFDAAVTHGQFSKDSAMDTQVKVGGGFGVGLGGALHWSDDDKDGEREYGFGVDLKFVSFDFKSEALDERMFGGFPGGKIPGLDSLLSDAPKRTSFKGGIKPLHF